MGNKKQQINLDDLDEFIIGAEGEEEDPGAGGAGGEDPDPNGEHDDADDPKVKGLKSSLAKERAAAKASAAAAKASAKELKILQDAQTERELAEKTGIDKATAEAKNATEKLTAAEERAAKLAQGLLTRDVNDAIRAAANKAGFLDVDDALNGVDRTDLATQDDDDPTLIEVDVKAIEKRVKALAEKKPHYLKTGTPDNQPSGSGFGGSSNKRRTSDEQKRDEYLEAYPSLR